MSRYFLAFIILLFVVSCSGKRENSSEVGLNISMFSGLASSLPGGLILYGYNHDEGESISIKLENTDKTVFLRNGKWDFFLIGWSGTNALEGTIYCAGSDVELNGAEVTVALSLSEESCSGTNPIVDKFIGTNDFMNLNFNSCYSHTPASTSCDNLGNAASFRVSLLTEFEDVDGLLVKDKLTSVCVDLTLASGSNSEIKIPFGTKELSNFDTEIEVFENVGCSGDTESIQVDRGLAFEVISTSSDSGSGLSTSVSGAVFNIVLSTPGLTSAKNFISFWETTTVSETITLPLTASYNYNFWIDWGDGTPLQQILSNTDPNKSHTYSNPGRYRVVIIGTLEGWSFNSTGSKLNLREVVNFGDLGWVNLSGAFWGCSNLTSFSGGSTSLVTNMSSMFKATTQLTSLDLSGFDTANVTSMASMFESTTALVELDISSFSTSLVTNMSSMFKGANKLVSLDLSHFDTAAVTTMASMFEGAIKLQTLNVSNFNTGAVTNMSSMFKSTQDLVSLDLSTWNTSNVTTMANMFMSASSLVTLDISGFSTANVTTMAHMFNGALMVTSLDVSSFDTSSVTSMASMFYNVTAVTSLDVSGWDTSSVTDMSSMFFNVDELTSLDVSAWNTTNVTNMGGMFSGMRLLTTLDVSGFNTANVTSMGSMFYGIRVTSLDISGFNTSSVTNMGSMFAECDNLTSLDLSGFDTSNVTNMSLMFKGADSITSLDLSGFDTTLVTDMDMMFLGTTSLSSLNISSFNTSNVTTMVGMFKDTSALTSIDLSHFQTTNVTDMSTMFSNTGATNININGWDISNALGSLNVLNGSSITTVYCNDGTLGSTDFFGIACSI